MTTAKQSRLVSIPKSDLDSLEATVETLENEYVMDQQEPQSGKPLRGKLHGLWQLRIGPFRVWYEINEEQKKVTLRAILHKDEAKKYY